MSSDPERPIEKLLRTRARRRREQAGESWELHPATRRLLQQEVARRFGRKGEQGISWLSWLAARSWLKPLTAAGAIAVVMVGLWLTMRAPDPDKGTQLMAKKEARRSEETERL